MHALALDLGGTKLAASLLDENGVMSSVDVLPVSGRQGDAVGELICEQVANFFKGSTPVAAIGVCVPGISNADGTVWAPNIPGWDDYPLLQEIRNIAPDVPVTIENDRACYVLGERWRGAASGCRDAVFFAVGTGIGAGILVDGKVLRGANGAAGSIGWMALHPPFVDDYTECGCFESRASGAGIVELARQIMRGLPDYKGTLKKNTTDPEITAADVFRAFDENDPVAKRVVHECIVLWAMAIANLISILNPEKIIMGGGVFGPALRFLPEIRREVLRWAQPVASRSTAIEPSALGPHAGLYGVAYLAFQHKRNREVS